MIGMAIVYMMHVNKLFTRAIRLEPHVLSKFNVMTCVSTCDDPKRICNLFTSIR